MLLGQYKESRHPNISENLTFENSDISDQWKIGFLIVLVQRGCIPTSLLRLR